MRTTAGSWLLPLAFFTLMSLSLRAADPAAAPLLPAPAPAAVPGKADTGKDEVIPEKTPAKHDASLDLYWQAMKVFRDGKAPDWEHGRTLLQEAADMENTHAQNQLGTCYLGGSYGYTKDAKKAVSWFRLAASRGNAFAKVNLAQCYFNGFGAPKDHDQAAILLNAAVANDADYSAPEPPADFFTAPAAKPDDATKRSPQTCRSVLQTRPGPRRTSRSERLERKRTTSTGHKSTM